MGAFDWATTLRENIQAPIGHAVQFARQNPLPTALSLGTAPFWAGLASEIPGVGQASKPAAPQTTTTNNQGGQPTDPSAVPFNPLAVAMFYNQSVAPMMSNLSNQFTQENQNFVNLAQSAVGNQYLTPDERTMAGMIQGNMALGNQLASQDAMKAAMNAPTIDQIQQQMSTLSQRALQSYTEALKNTAANQAALYTNPSGGQTQAATTPGTAPGTSLPSYGSIFPSNTSPNTLAGVTISGAGLTDAQKQQLISLGATIN